MIIMRVLWITNGIFPEAQGLLLGKPGVVNGSGGWLSSAADALVAVDNMHLGVVAISDAVSRLTRLDGEKMTYYFMPAGQGNLKINKEYIPIWKEIAVDFQPDLIHLHGTELSHGWSLLEALPEAKTVISIQGLISQICHFYTSGMTKKDIYCNITLRDLIHDIVKRKVMCGSLIRQRKGFVLRGKNERLILQRAKAVIGRTTWDRANVLAINPQLSYYFCNETLRKEFYTGQWRYDKCTPYTIFLSQANFPYKGLHMIIKAMPLILQSYPSAQIVVAGSDVLGGDSLKERIKLSGYSKYIKKLMKDRGLKRDIIRFTGPLDADGMKKQYLDCNVFVSPSSIENSPNSVCEAQMLGVPVVASYVGGTPDIVSNNNSGRMYRFEDVEMLAQLIKDVFSNASEFDGSLEMSLARKRHDRESNLKQLIQIYTSILK